MASLATALRFLGRFSEGGRIAESPDDSAGDTAGLKSTGDRAGLGTGLIDGDGIPAGITEVLAC